MEFFLSSTYTDLIEERKAAMKILELWGPPIVMENFGARSYPSKDVCIEELQKADGYVLIFGQRYGSIADGYGCSVTELEYRTAKELNIKNKFAFVQVDNDGKWNSSETDLKMLEMQKKFKSDLGKDLTWATFSNIEELKEKLFAAMKKHEEAVGFKARFSTFQSYTDFFKPFLNTGNIFNHIHPFIGRTNQKQTIEDFLASEKRILVLSGAGGTGKSRLLLEGLANKNTNDSNHLHFLRDGLSFTPEAIKELPAGANVIVVDDGHRVDKLELLLKLAENKERKTQLILTTRPYSLRNITELIARSGLEPADYNVMPELTSLTKEESKGMVKSMVKNQSDEFYQRVIKFASDNPFILVITCNLLSSKKLRIEELVYESTFKDLVFSRFQETLLGAIKSEFTPQTIKELFRLIAVLSPFRPTRDHIFTRVAEFLKLKPYQLEIILGELKQAGATGEKGYIVKIIPDVLSDYVLKEACFKSDNSLTGFHAEIAKFFGDVALIPILTNIAQIEWKFQGGTMQSAFAELWKNILKETQSYDENEMRSFLEGIQNFAFFKPRELLEFIQGVVSKYPQTQEARFYKPICNTLNVISHHHDFLPSSTDLLFKFMKFDARQTNSYPEHPYRILEDLIKYGISKPILYNDLMLNQIQKWVSSDNVSSWKNSPLFLLKHLFAVEATDDRMEGWAFVWSPFRISLQKTKPLREKALAYLDELMAQNPYRGVRYQALTILIKALRGDSGYHTRFESTTEENLWLSEKSYIIDSLYKELTSTTFDVHKIKIRDVLYHMLCFKTIGPDLLSKVDNVLVNSPPDFNEQFLRCLWWGATRQACVRDQNYKDEEKVIEKETAAVATLLPQHKATNEEQLGFIKSQYDLLRLVGEAPIQYNFLFYVVNNIKGLAVLCCENSIKMNCDLISRTVNYALFKMNFPIIQKSIEFPREEGEILTAGLTSLSQQDQKLALKYTTQLALSRNGKVSQFALRNIFNNPLLEDIYRPIIIYFLKRGSIEQKELLFRLFWQINEKEESKYLPLFLKIKINDTSGLAESFFSALSYYRSSNYDKLPPGHVDYFLSQISTLDRLDDGLHFTWEFINFVAAKEPDKILDLFLTRLKQFKKIKDTNDKFDPVPHHDFANLNMANVSADTRLKCLNKIIKALRKDNGQAYYWLEKLFVLFTSGFDTVTLGILDALVEKKTKKDIRLAAGLFSQTHYGDIFGRHEFVNKMLHAAEQIDEETLRLVKGALYSCLINGSYSNTPGTPAHRHLHTIEECKKMISLYGPGTKTGEFFDSMLKSTEQSIARGLKEDEERKD